MIYFQLFINRLLLLRRLKILKLFAFCLFSLRLSLIAALSLVNNGRWLNNIIIGMGLHLLQLSHWVLNVISSQSCYPIDTSSITWRVFIWLLLASLVVVQMLKFFDCFIDIVVLTRKLSRVRGLQLHGESSLTFFSFHCILQIIVSTLYGWDSQSLPDCC